ncbi:hypothetical protein FRC07_007159 [Ceratobasidium sp. 392]|nr:hypothetical protein FRC07_007159 [Ceratobasidium sp. 392]
MVVVKIRRDNQIEPTDEIHVQVDNHKAMKLFAFGLVVAASAALSAAQTTCENFGTVSPSDPNSCICPPAFGGATCNAPACGGNLFQGAQRSVSQNASTGGASVTGCGCQDGWSGAGCNVCQSQSVCQSAFAAAGGSSGSGSATSPLGAGQVGNQTLTCSTQSRVYAAQEMSCAVINPTLQAVFPLQANLNILRTLDPALTPSPNITSFGSAGSAFAQLFYDGVEQFYCSATDCKQTVGNDTTDWTCASLKCNCRPGTMFCGAGSLNLAPTLNSLSGQLSVSCTTSTAACSFKQQLLQALFGSNGLGLSNCVFGECVRQSVIDSALGITPVGAGSGNSLSGGVIAGLAVVGAAVLVLAALLAWGCVTQNRARGAGPPSEKVYGRRIGVEWRNVGYTVSPAGAAGSGISLFRRSRTELGSTSVIELRERDVETGEDKPLPVLPHSQSSGRTKTILASLSGSVRAGQMLAILGPSGAGKTTLISILAGRAAHDPENPVAVVASIHQPSSRLYHQFDSVLLLARGRQVYFGPGGTAPVRAFAGAGVRPMDEGYNVADYLLEVASEGVDGSVVGRASGIVSPRKSDVRMRNAARDSMIARKDSVESGSENGVIMRRSGTGGGRKYAATFLTQVEVLCGREWKNLKRDKTLFFMHLAVACVLGIFTGGLYFHVKTTISGFQNRVGSLFFMASLPSSPPFQLKLNKNGVMQGSLLAFSSLSALYNLVEVRALFTRERAGAYYSPAAWLTSRVLFDVVPLRIVPTVVMATITYWMVGLSPDAARFFKALLVLVLFALAMTLFYFSILKYLLEALAVNEVGSGLMIQDTLEGVPVNVSAALIMELLFGFGVNNYYRFAEDWLDDVELVSFLGGERARGFLLESSACLIWSRVSARNRALRFLLKNWSASAISGGPDLAGLELAAHRWLDLPLYPDLPLAAHG